MRNILIIFIFIIQPACVMQVVSPQRDYRIHLNKDEKDSLNKGNPILKNHISYRRNDQIYWTGPLKVEKINKKYKFTRQGIWKQFYDNGDLLAIDKHDNDGFLEVETIYALDGRIIAIISERKDTISNSSIRYRNVKSGFYDNGQVMLNEEWLIVNNKYLKHGTWQYFNEDGSIIKLLFYDKGKVKM